MRKLLFVCGVSLLSLAVASPVRAQETATLVLQNGERPSGELVDLNASGFILRVNGQDRQFPVGDVRSIEFVGGAPPADAQAQLNAGRPIVILRSGQVVEGRLTDIGGARPLRISVDTPSGAREFSSSDVAQIYLRGGSGQAVAAAPAPAPAQAGQAVSAPARAGAVTINVPANQPWTETGLLLARGERVQFQATGDVMIAANASSGVGGSPAVTVAGRRYQLANAPAGALIGRIGNGPPFLIGASSQPIEIPTTGRLMLGVNDDEFSDNTGTYSVSINRLGR